MKRYTEILPLSDADLKKTLGKVAILEGGFSIPENGYLTDIKKVLTDSIELELTSIYYEHEKLLSLVENQIDTILMETTFTYQDKIYDVAEFLLKMYFKTGWKPKRIINSLDYGLEAFWVICNPVDIELYRIEDADREDIGTFQLNKVGFDEFDGSMIKVKYLELHELTQENLNKNKLSDGA